MAQLVGPNKEVVIEGRLTESGTRRSRSILKNSTPLVTESAFHPKNTAVNTRRNGQVAVAESRYFAAATSQPQRSSCTLPTQPDTS